MSFVCVICFESLGTGDVSAIQCGHLYHSQCLEDWFIKSKTCPQCRKNVDQSNIVFPMFFTDVVEESPKATSNLLPMNDAEALNVLGEDLEKINSSLDNMLEELLELHTTFTPSLLIDTQNSPEHFQSSSQQDQTVSSDYRTSFLLSPVASSRSLSSSRNWSPVTVRPSTLSSSAPTSLVQSSHQFQSCPSQNPRTSSSSSPVVSRRPPTSRSSGGSQSNSLPQTKPVVIALKPLVNIKESSSSSTLLGQHPTSSRSSRSKSVANIKESSSSSTVLDQNPTSSRISRSKSLANIKESSSSSTLLDQHPTSSRSSRSKSLAKAKPVVIPLNPIANIKESSRSSTLLGQHPTSCSTDLSLQNHPPNSNSVTTTSRLTAFSSDTSHVTSTVRNIASTSENTSLCNNAGSIQSHDIVIPSPALEAGFMDAGNSTIKSFLNSKYIEDSSDTSEYSFLYDINNISQNDSTQRSFPKHTCRQPACSSSCPFQQQSPPKNLINKNQLQQSEYFCSKPDSVFEEHRRNVIFWKTSTYKSESDRQPEKDAKFTSVNPNISSIPKCYPNQIIICKAKSSSAESSSAFMQTKTSGKSYRPLRKMENDNNNFGPTNNSTCGRVSGNMAQQRRKRSGTDKLPFTGCRNRVPNRILNHSQSSSLLTVSTPESINRVTVTYSNNSRIVTWDSSCVLAYLKWMLVVIIVIAFLWFLVIVIIRQEPLTTADHNNDSICPRFLIAFITSIRQFLA